MENALVIELLCIAVEIRQKFKERHRNHTVNHKQRQHLL